MTVGEKSRSEDYDAFYRRGGWVYDLGAERRFLWSRILLPLGIQPGAEALELGCGMGHHTNLLASFGLNVVGVDQSREAIAAAAALYPHEAFVNAEATEYLTSVGDRTLNLVLARGLSWFHYELSAGRNRRGTDVTVATKLILRKLKRRNPLVVQVRTDFSGSWHESGVRNHTWADVVTFFGELGEIILLTDWYGSPLASAREAELSQGNLLVACAAR
jgi:SAM-dependent methyltransferase